MSLLAMGFQFYFRKQCASPRRWDVKGLLLMTILLPPILTFFAARSGNGSRFGPRTPNGNMQRDGTGNRPLKKVRVYKKVDSRLGPSSSPHLSPLTTAMNPGGTPAIFDHEITSKEGGAKRNHRAVSSAFARVPNQYHLPPEFLLCGHTSLFLSHCNLGLLSSQPNVFCLLGKTRTKLCPRDSSQQSGALRTHLLFHRVLSKIPRDQRYDPIFAAVGSGAPTPFRNESKAWQLAIRCSESDLAPPPGTGKAPLLLHGPARWRPRGSSGPSGRGGRCQGGCYCKSGVEAPRYTLRSERVDWTSLAGMVSRCSCW